MSGSIRRKRRTRAKGLNGANLDPIVDVPPQTINQKSEQTPMAKTGAQPFQLAIAAQAPRAG